MHWKFLLFGITGNLAKIKILPGLSQFARLNSDKVSVELIGYSRSLPKIEEIELALNSGLDNSVHTKITPNKVKIQDNSKNSPQKKHNLTKISFIQGSYEDGTVLFEEISKLQKDEKLVVYLAVPPSTFIKFLQNACPFSQSLLDIIVEKPFGRDPIEAEKLLSIVNSCNLHSQVHFCDHYLFKNATLPSPEQVSQIQSFFDNSDSHLKLPNKNSPEIRQNVEEGNVNLPNSDSKITKQTSIFLSDSKNPTIAKDLISPTNSPNLEKKITKDFIHIQILEKVDLVGRAGYFDSTGALKDMWPHLFSLLVLTLQTAGFDKLLELKDVIVEQVFLGQYASYCQEAGLEDSVTETYFRIKLQAKNLEIILESGKNLPTKITQIELVTKNFQNQTKKLLWNIYPHQNLTLQNSVEKNLKSKNIQNKSQIIELAKEKLDQTNLFEFLLVENKNHFVSTEKIRQSWQIWQKIMDFIAFNQIKIDIYDDQKLPQIN